MASAGAGAVGIDFGGSTAVIAIAKKGGVEVIINEASHRETHVVVGFGEHERFIGEAGYVQLKSNFKNTIVYPNRFLGIRADAPYFQEEKKWLYSPITITQDNKVLFDVTYKGEKKQFSPEQLTAMMLQKLKQNIRKNDVSHNDMVLSVPSYYTEQERKALLDAAKIAEINVLRLLNESTAIALGYGIFRKAELDATPRNVCFVDFGHTNTSVFVASFTNQKTKILNQLHERNLGVRDIDWKLLEFYGKICVEQYDANPLKKEKSRLRLIDAIEKQRKVLSANSEAAINVDYIVEDNDLSYVLTREKLEELATPVAERLRTLCETLKAEIKVPIHSLEIVGGGTRIPIIQRAIQEVFGLDLSRTLNASECIARGCAIQAAMLSPLFKVAQYEIEEANYYPIRCSWHFKDNATMEVESDAKNNPEKQTSILFSQGCSVPNIKSVTFHRDEFIDFKLFYDPVPPGADKILAQYIVHPAKPKEQEFGIKVRVQLNKDTIVEFDSAQLIEEYAEPTSPEKMVDEKKEAQAPKTDIKKKTRTTKLQVDLSNFNSLTDKQINQLFEEECNMTNQDRVTHETYEKKNELESYIYNTRSKLNEEYTQYSTSEQRNALLQELEKAESWLYSEGMKTTKSVYGQKLDELKKLGDPITNRYKEYHTIPDTTSDFNQNLGIYESVAKSTDPKFEHITQEERQALLDAINEQKYWLQQSGESFAKANRLENPPVTSQDILNRHRAFVEKHYSTINKPKPKPQPTQPPKAEPTAQNQEAPKDGGADAQEPKKDMEEEK